MVRKRKHRVAAAIAVLVLSYIALAYVLLPAFWSDRERDAASSTMLTRTAEGLAGDPLNVAVAGEPQALLMAMAAAGWSPAEPITFETSVEIVGSVLFDRPDSRAPVSPLFYQGRREDLAFEKEVGRSADRRQHVRFWRDGERDGIPFFVGAASYDAGVGLSQYTGAVTHRIAPDLDAARVSLVRDLEATGRVARTVFIEGVGPTEEGRNGEGDLYVTDGRGVLIVMEEGESP